jgi:hypothetical protein
VRRRLIAASILVAACASAGPPPGGPEDRVPPRLVRVTPDTNAVNFHEKNATFFFDEQINDRGAGENEINSYFLVSPNDGAAHVSWHRSRIEVRARHGFRANTAYTITLLPGLSDLRGNRMKTGAELVFSTGPTIPTLRIKGNAFDWMTERPQPDALIEAITPDSIVYLAQADSLGAFTVGPLNPGTYLVRGTIDQNRNRTQDRTEPYDTVRVTTPQTAPLQLLMAPRDTLPARIQTVALADSVTLTVTFDRLLDPSQAFPTSNFRLVLVGTGVDSVVIPISATRTPHEERDRQLALQRQAADSARRADSLAGRPRPAPPRTQARPDTTGPKPSRPGPFTTLSVIVPRPLVPSTTYRLSVTTVRALSGRVTGSERQFTTPKPPPPPRADTTRTLTPRGAPPPTTPPVTPPTTPPSRGP